MDSFEINKIIAAVLLTALIIIGIGKFTDILFHIDKPKVSAYKIEGDHAEVFKGPSTDGDREKVLKFVIGSHFVLGDEALGKYKHIK